MLSIFAAVVVAVLLSGTSDVAVCAPQAGGADPMQAFIQQSVAFSKSLTKEEREKYIQISGNMNMPKGQMNAAFQAFAATLAPAKKQAALAIHQQMMGMQKQMIPQVDSSTLSGSALQAYTQIQQIVNNDSLSPMASCEQMLAVMGKLSAEDKAKLKMPAAGGAGGGASPCAQMGGLVAQWLQQVKAAGGQ